MDLRINGVTFNVAEEPPSRDIGNKFIDSMGVKPDVFIVALQEVDIAMQLGAFLFWDQWTEKVSIGKLFWNKNFAIKSKVPKNQNFWKTNFEIWSKFRFFFANPDFFANPELFLQTQIFFTNPVFCLQTRFIFANPEFFFTNPEFFFANP